LTQVAEVYLDRIALYDMFYKNSYRILKKMFA
jgi:hypothetical protein